MVVGNKEKKEHERQESERRRAEANELAAQRLAKAKAQRAQEIQTFVSDVQAKVRNTVESGTPVSLFTIRRLVRFGVKAVR